MNVLVLGATGLLGNVMFRVLSEAEGDKVVGTIRDPSARQLFIDELGSNLVVVKDLMNPVEMEALFDSVQPSVVINCIALAKSSPQDPMSLISVFSLLPHRLSRLCQQRGIRFVQISSDGVFSGKRGGYVEDDIPDASDPYGVAKILGEVGGPGSITLRTSIIGREITSKNGLLEWFLSQSGECRCYPRAIFSGFPSVVLARIVRDVIIPRPALHGLYHLATTPISKFDLLNLVAKRYGKSIRIVPDESVVIDRSLSSARFSRMTGYIPPAWPVLVDEMHDYKYGLKGY